jgi:hypothetical protein
MRDGSFLSTQVVDRRDELDIFKTLLAEAAEPRVLAIEVEGGVGKSELLKLLHHYATMKHDPFVPAALVTVEEQPRIWFVEQIAKQLTHNWDLRLPTYESLDFARRDQSWEPFAQQLSLASETGDAVRRRGSYTLEQAGQPGLTTYSAGWSPAKEDLAQRECIRAFLDDLKTAAGTQPIAILLDRYEKRSDDLHDWLIGQLCRRVFDNEQGYGGLVLVIAGRKMRSPLPGLRDLLGPNFPRYARCIDSLSTWDDDDVRQWLDLLGVDYQDADVPVIRMGLSGNWTLRQMKDFVTQKAKQEEA